MEEDKYLISLTRGNIKNIDVTAKNLDGTDFTFKQGDLVRFKVMEKKDCQCVVLQKDVVVDSDTTLVTIPLTMEETDFGEVASKPVDYWYEIDLNPDTARITIVGYDEIGEKTLTLYPRGEDKQ
jgi:hypothetical protein